MGWSFMRKNMKVILGSSVVLLSILVMLIVVTPSVSGSEVSISHLVENKEELQDTFITTEGLLVDGSIDWDADQIELKFELEDESGGVLPVHYEGVEPDNFTDEVYIIVHGHIDQDGIFTAENVQTRCPSTYEGMDMDPAEYDPEIHRQKDVEESTE